MAVKPAVYGSLIGTWRRACKNDRPHPFQGRVPVSPGAQNMLPGRSSTVRRTCRHLSQTLPQNSRSAMCTTPASRFEPPQAAAPRDGSARIFSRFGRALLLWAMWVSVDAPGSAIAMAENAVPHGLLNRRSDRLWRQFAWHVPPSRDLCRTPKRRD